MKIIFKLNTIIIVLLVFQLAVSLSAMAESDNKPPGQLTFVFTRPKDNPMTQWLSLIYTEALRRMNIKFVFKEVPPKRASRYSDDGDVDAELGRIYDYNQTHPNLIRVEEHTQFVFFSAFAVIADLNLQGWDSLKETNYRVEYRYGIQKCSSMLSPIIPPERLSTIPTVHQGIKKLVNGRTDVYVDVDNVVVTYLKTKQFKKISQGQEIYNAGIMERTTAHAFLHKKYRLIAPKLAGILSDMKKEGLFELYRNQTGLTKDDAEW